MKGNFEQKYTYLLIYGPTPFPSDKVDSGLRPPISENNLRTELEIRGIRIGNITKKVFLEDTKIGDKYLLQPKNGKPVTVSVVNTRYQCYGAQTVVGIEYFESTPSETLQAVLEMIREHECFPPDVPKKNLFREVKQYTGKPIY